MKLLGKYLPLIIVVSGIAGGIFEAVGIEEASRPLILICLTALLVKVLGLDEVKK